MKTNKTTPTSAKVSEFLATVTEQRKAEAESLIAIMTTISKLEPVMWGPSIIGFGTQHYVYDSGREGDMPLLSFSPRKSAITVYFQEGFSHHTDSLASLGAHTTSVSCLYIKKLSDISLDVLTDMLHTSYEIVRPVEPKSMTVESYIAQIPPQARIRFDELRAIVKKEIPDAEECISYGIVGYRLVPGKRALVYISGWKDHVGIYPVPRDETLQKELTPHIKGKGTLSFPLDTTLDPNLIRRVVKSLTGQ